MGERSGECFSWEGTRGEDERERWCAATDGRRRWTGFIESCGEAIEVLRNREQLSKMNLCLSIFVGFQKFGAVKKNGMFKKKKVKKSCFDFFRSVSPRGPVFMVSCKVGKCVQIYSSTAVKS